MCLFIMRILSIFCVSFKNEIAEWEEFSRVNKRKAISAFHHCLWFVFRFEDSAMRLAVETKATTTTKEPQITPTRSLFWFSHPLINLFALMINYKIPLTFHNSTKKREIFPPSSIHEIFITSRKDQKFSRSHRFSFNIKPFLSSESIEKFSSNGDGFHRFVFVSIWFTN